LLSRFKSEAGSAVKDFVLLVVPASLLVLPLFDLFGMLQAAIVKQQLGYDIARYAALADVDSTEANRYLRRYPDGSLTKESTIYSCAWIHSSEISRRVTLWPELIAVPIESRAECEK